MEVQLNYYTHVHSSLRDHRHEKTMWLMFSVVVIIFSPHLIVHLLYLLKQHFLQAPGKKPPAVRPSPVPVASPTVPGPLSAAISEEMQEKFEEELAWCIHQLKNSLTSKKLGPKQGITTSLFQY